MRVSGVMTAAAAAAGALAATSLIGCSSTSAPASPSKAEQAARTSTIALATSQTYLTGASWAVTRNDGSWQLFARPPGSTAWKQVTPGGVSSGAWPVIAGNGNTLLTGFRPSRQVTESPVTWSSDEGSSWSSHGNSVRPALASVPSALALSSDHQVLAVTDAGTVRRGAHLGGIWSSLTSRDSLARSSVTGACGLVSLTSAAFSSAGAPMVGGACDKPGKAGIFEFDDAAWHAAGPTMPAALDHSTVSVLGLATVSGTTTALLAVGSGSDAGLVAAWTGRTSSGSGASGWKVSPELRIGSAGLESLSLWPDGGGRSRAERVTG